MAPFISLEHLFSTIYNFFAGAEVGISDRTVFIIKLIATFLSIFFVYIILYSLWKTSQLLDKKGLIKEDVVPPTPGEIKEGHFSKWQAVKERLMSDIPSDWRIAVLEADIFLEDALINKGYQGENLGDRLKNIKPHSLRNLDKAWDAHRIRNEIAHEADREITKLEVDRAISNYEEVLKELNFI